MANVAYIRVSSKQQDTIRQDFIFEKSGITLDEIFTEKISAKDTNRPELKKLLQWVRKGDTVYIESFSRLARNTKDLLDIVDKLKNKDVKIISLKEKFDTDTPQGKLMLGMFGLLYEFERECTLERQKEAIEARKEKGLQVGRPRIKTSKTFIKNYQEWKAGKITAVACMKREGLTKGTFYRIVKRYEKGLSNG